MLTQERKQEGRPKALDTDAVDKSISLLDYMVVQTDSQWEVIADILRRRARC